MTLWMESWHTGELHFLLTMENKMRSSREGRRNSMDEAQRQMASLH